MKRSGRTHDLSWVQFKPHKSTIGCVETNCLKSPSPPQSPNLIDPLVGQLLLLLQLPQQGRLEPIAKAET